MIEVYDEYWKDEDHQNARHAQAEDQQIAGGFQGAEPEV